MLNILYKTSLINHRAQAKPKYSQPATKGRRDNISPFSFNLQNLNKILTVWPWGRWSPLCFFFLVLTLVVALAGLIAPQLGPPLFYTLGFPAAAAAELPVSIDRWRFAPRHDSSFLSLPVAMDQFRFGDDPRTREHGSRRAGCGQISSSWQVEEEGLYILRTNAQTITYH